ncbi:MAG: phosphate ABC transporter permease PstA [Balneola sp.]|jgi:phosphate transport system permease protein
MNRASKNILFTRITQLSVTLCFIVLIFLFGVIFWNGVPAISFEFITTKASNFGSEGGVLYQLLGSVLIVFVAACLSLPVSIGAAIYKSEYLKSSRGQNFSDILIFGLNGIPSVVFGIFGLILFVNIFGFGISWFVGSVILAIMMLPTIILSTFQSINNIPTIYRESALALGLDKWQTITKVLLPQGFSGAVTGLLIGLARAIGETAPIMFIATAFSGVELPTGLREPVSTLPTHILALAQQATDPVALQNAWGSSFILIILVMLFSISALFIRVRKNKFSLS